MTGICIMPFKRFSDLITETSKKIIFNSQKYLEKPKII